MAHPLVERLTSADAAARRDACRAAADDPSAVLLVEALAERLADADREVVRAASDALVFIARHDDAVAPLMLELRAEAPSFGDEPREALPGGLPLFMARTLRVDDRVAELRAAGFSDIEHEMIRDEAVFERSDVFDLTRPRMGQLAFGFGVHHCLGANLARLETEVAIGALLERTRHIERVDDESLPLHPSPVFRGVTKLPLRLTPA